MKDDILNRKVDELAVPIRELRDGESIALGLRQAMLDLDGEDVHASVTTGTGLGTDFIILNWEADGTRQSALLRGGEILKAWVRTFDPERAEQIPAKFG